MRRDRRAGCGVIQLAIWFWVGLAASVARAEIVGAPFLINSAVDVSGQPTDQWDHRAASDGNSWLVIWEDDWNDEIYGMRLDAQGRSLDAAAHLIAPNSVGNVATERRYPMVAWFQDAYWVVWQEYRGSGVREGYGRRLQADGTFLDMIPFRAETTSAAAYRSGLCAGAANLLMTWSTYSSSYRLWAQAYAPDGLPMGTATQIVTGLSGYTQPGMAFEPGSKRYLVVFALNSDIRGVRMSEGGTMLDAIPFAICTNAGSQSAPVAACGLGPGGTQGWWVAWMDSRSGDSDLYGAFVTPEGNVSHSATGLPLIVAEGAQSDPSLCGDGARYLLGWHDDREPVAVRASLMDAAGICAEPAGALVATNEQYVPVFSARTNGQFLAVSGYDSVYAATVAAQGGVLAAGTQRLVSVSGAYERYNSGACDGSNYWVVFEYHPAHPERGGDIALQRLDAGGRLAAAAPLMVCTNPAEQWGPALAAGPDVLYAVWSDERNTRDQIWCQRIGRDGALLGTNLQIGTSTLYAYFCAIAAAGTNFLAVWSDAGGDRMQGRFLYADGSLSALVTPFNYDISDPFITSGGGNYLVLAVDNNSPNYVRFRRYRADEAAMDGGSSNLYQSASPCWEPQAAFNPANNQYLVTWRDQATYQILGRTLDAQTAMPGGVFTALVINAWTSSENCGVVYDGTDWLCLFRDTRGGRNGLYGVRVGAGGNVLDAAAFPLLPGGSIGTLAAAVAPCTNVLIMGSKQVYTVQGRTYNTRKNLAMFWQPGAPSVPGAAIEACRVQAAPGAFEFRQTAPASTNFIVESCASLPENHWQALTNCLLLDSGASITAQWLAPAGPADALLFRALGQ